MSKSKTPKGTFIISNSYQRVITLLSDTHVGALHSVFPDNFSVYEGSNAEAIMNLNSVQKQLLGYFKDFSEQSKINHSDTLIILGDLIAGMNPVECGRAMMFAEMDQQIKAFCALINNHFSHIKNIYILKGTNFHEAKYVEELEKAAFILKQNGFNAKYIGSISNLRICKEPKEIIANIAHEGPDACVYPETPMARAINEMLRGVALGKVPRVKLIIRGHKHRWEHIDKHGVHFIQVPCWQTFVPYEKARMHYYAYQPDIGGVLLLIDEHSRIRVWEYLYDLPHLEDCIREG